MFYPEFLKKGDKIGICAPSAGVGDRAEEVNLSNEVLKKHGYKVIETASVRSCNPRSTTAKKRGAEIDELVLNKEVKLIACATGGDYMYEIMPYINFRHIAENPKWIAGMSDPTNLLYPVTAGLDIATFYGHNGCGFSEQDKTKQTFLKMAEGNLSQQKSFSRYQSFLDSIQGSTKLDKKVEWLMKDEGSIEGRLLGGCLEAIEKFLGTPYDHTAWFLEKYKEDGIVWFFDVFSMSAYNFYLTLLQMKYAGYFKYCTGVLIGRVAFPTVDDPKLDYIKAADKALGKIPHIMEMDIGHTNPGMSLINGALVKVKCKEKKGTMKFTLD